ncbi:MAG: hypothetical protein AAFU64_07380 [Bacteroidota bacterium]
MNNILFPFIFVLGLIHSLYAQEAPFKKISQKEEAMLVEIFNEIQVRDQKYRDYLAAGTLDDRIIARLDSVGDQHGVEAYIKYRKSLNLSLEKEVRDSLWALQHQLDLANHLQYRGILRTYGFIPKKVLGKIHYIQILLLMHPPAAWDVQAYLDSYITLLRPEVEAGRMPAKVYAQFYDDIKVKILKEMQLYGAIQRFDHKSNSIQPPIIENLAKSNQARKAIGLEPLKEGEYVLAADIEE